MDPGLSTSQKKDVSLFPMKKRPWRDVSKRFNVTKEIRGNRCVQTRVSY